MTVSSSTPGAPDRVPARDSTIEQLGAPIDACLPAAGRFVVHDEGWARRLRRDGRDVASGPIDRVAPGGADVVALLAGELSDAGDHAEALLALAVTVTRPGGLVAVTVPNRVFADAVGHDLGARRGFDARELARMLGHVGCAVELLCAPGATARLAGRTAVDLQQDRRPGLLDAAPVLFAVARSAGDAAARSRRFFSTLPRKVIAAAVLCRVEHRVLVVHDAFKQHWTIPGGIVEPDEDPHAGAEREAWEETGIRVRAGALLGTFSGSHPDRVVFVYAATPVEPGTPRPTPVHAHEIDGAAWMPVADALDRLAPHVASQVSRCLEAPHRSWRD